MKYRANPVLVDAFKITEVKVAYRVLGGAYKDGDTIKQDGGPGEFMCKLEDGSQRHATPEMCARMSPAVGDYWVVQEDGYAYLNPREVFERKYSPIP